MSSGFQPLPSIDLAKAIEDLLFPRLADSLRDRGPGHCMRIADLAQDLMVALARRLRRELPGLNIYILANGSTPTADRDLYITSTKLVELRNPLPDGTLRPPLCVFLPANLRTSAEDSFGNATFEDFPVGDAYRVLQRTLLERIPTTLRGYVRDMLQYLGQEHWHWANSVGQTRYVLCALANGGDGESFGGALYELGLVPDFRFLDDPAAAFGRLVKNLDCVRKLTDSDLSIRARVLNLGLVNRGLRRKLADYLVEMGVEDPVAWTREIVIDKKNWDISFDKWEFASELSPDRVEFLDIQTDLPVVAEDETDERLLGLIGQQILAPKDLKKFSVAVEVSPHPTQVRGLDHFTVQIVSNESGPVGAVRKVKVWQTNRNCCNVSFSRLNKIDFEEGWHFVRVLPWTVEGDPIPIVEPAEQAGKRPNDSEPFYVLPEAELEDEPPQRAVPKALSVEHARLDRQFSAVLQGRDPNSVAPESVSWTERSAGRHSAVSETIEAKFGKEGTFQVAVARWLKDVEQRILNSPRSPVSWRMQINLGQPETPTYDVADWPESVAVESFLDARETYFRLVLQETKQLVSQGTDFLAVAQQVMTYASSYVDLLRDLFTKIELQRGQDQQRALVVLRSALAVDTIRLAVQDYRGHVREAAILGPTHPLRALWCLAWSQVGQAWVYAAEEGREEHVAPAREAILHGVSSVNFPAILPVSDGRLFVSVDNLHPFWSLYAPAREEDPRGLLGDVCSALGLPEPSIGSVINGDLIASRLERYLIQHPYVRTLTINAFNPGRATVLADALGALQRIESLANLHYNIRLFVPDPDAPAVGESLSALASSGSASASDAFSTPAGSHIFPKLTIAVLDAADFRSRPHDFRAHLSILFDVFPPEDVAATRPYRPEGTIPLHSLIQEFNVRYRDDDTGTGWERQPRHGTPIPIKGAEDTAALLGSLAKHLSAASAAVARATPDFESRPSIRLELNPVDRALISHIHDISDWVLTVDRNIGIEFFDHGGRQDRPDYLIDYIPSGVPGHGHRLLISSRSLTELEALLRPVLQDYGLDAEGQKAVTILSQLRSLSGRLALKLVSSPTARAEVLGLSLARLFLEYQGALHNQIVVPLDAHLDLFHEVRRHAEALGDEVSLRRTDLALFDLDLPRRTITCNLVEVKCYAQELGLGGYAQIKEAITEQVNQSERVLQQHFDPHRTTPDRPDRLLKTRELATLLGFYLERSVRYGLMESQAAEEAQLLLEVLEEGYTLRFSRSGIIFDFEKAGTEPADHEVGVEFHRVGHDLIRAMFEQATRSRKPPPPESDDGEDRPDTGGPTPPAPPPPIPRLESAAFLVGERLRSTSLDLSADNLELVSTSPPKQDQSQMSEDSADVVENRGEICHAPSNASDNNELTSGDVTHSPLPEPPVHASRESSAVKCAPDITLGVTALSPQCGLLGETAGRTIALDLNHTHTISLFGVQAGGKSYTLGTILEMACMRIPGINILPRPLGSVIFHYSSTLEYKPEFTSMIEANSEPNEVNVLLQRYRAQPQALQDVVVLVPPSKVEERSSEYPHIRVQPISFAARELKAAHWKFLMGAVGSQSIYLRQIGLIMKKLRANLTLGSLRKEIEVSTLSDHLKDLALLRLQFAEQYIDDSKHLTEILRPGRLVIVDLRDELIEKDEALGLFVVLLEMFAEATHEGRAFNKLVVFDEAHKYIDNQDLVAGLIEVVREMRHKGTSIMVASQDPPSVPVALIELSTQLVLHKFNSPAWLKHIQKANAALDELSPSKLSSLAQGEAYVWSSKATDEAFAKGAVKIHCRPRVTLHGGATRTAIGQ